MEDANGHGPSGVDSQKRRASTPPIPKKLPRSGTVPVSNKFELLSDLPSNSDNKEEQVTAKPPPINITGNWPTGVATYQDLVAFLKNAGGNTFTLKTTTRAVIIYPNTPAAYRTFVHALKNSNCEFFTYQLQDDKQPTVVIRGLHPTTPIEEIKSELEDKGFIATKITNAVDRFKRPIPLFFVQIDKDTYNESISTLLPFTTPK